MISASISSPHRVRNDDGRDLPQTPSAVADFAKIDLVEPRGARLLRANRTIIRNCELPLSAMSSRRPLSSYASFEEPPWFAHWSVITVAIVVASVVALYSYNSRERERVRIEQDRAAAQQAARAAEIVAKENSQQRALSTLSKQAAERQALIEARDRSYQDARREYESRVNDSYENRALYRAQMESRQNELRAEIERNRAQSDLERQKQWLEEERREEQYAAERRAAADYVERQRKLYEEYRSRQRPQGLLR